MGIIRHYHFDWALYCAVCFRFPYPITKENNIFKKYHLASPGRIKNAKPRWNCASTMVCKYAHLFGHSYHLRCEWTITMQVTFSSVYIQFHNKKKFSVFISDSVYFWSDITSTKGMSVQPEVINWSYHRKKYKFCIKFYFVLH